MCNSLMHAFKQYIHKHTHIWNKFPTFFTWNLMERKKKSILPWKFGKNPEPLYYVVACSVLYEIMTTPQWLLM